ncbi:uncharacterized protein LOC129758305 [Uranotaenia lowii]|uniref:uncharacterized protein LOC129758305 n=1 Tax=Uranotaenia lowii TaxID=190385 RepID=UPI002478CBA7|nr:uncharacterized protein LOC129758305 [Uranotaenia lowii]
MLLLVLSFALLQLTVQTAGTCIPFPVYVKKLASCCNLITANTDGIPEKCFDLYPTVTAEQSTAEFLKGLTCFFECLDEAKQVTNNKEILMDNVKTMAQSLAVNVRDKFVQSYEDCKSGVGDFTTYFQSLQPSCQSFAMELEFCATAALQKRCPNEDFQTDDNECQQIKQGAMPCAFT